MVKFTHFHDVNFIRIEIKFLGYIFIINQEILFIIIFIIKIILKNWQNLVFVNKNA